MTGSRTRPTVPEFSRTGFRKLAEVPFAPSTVVRATVDATGRPLLALVGASDVELARHGGHTDSVPLQGVTARPYHLTVTALDGTRWEPLARVTADQLQPHVQCLSDGRLIVAGTYSRRCADGTAEMNGVVYDACGEIESRLLVGDGIDDLRATSNDELWVSYFDQGVTGDYGRLGWGRLSPDEWVEPLGHPGLVLFDASGRRRYAFAPPTGFQIVVDCYVLNIDGAGAWMSYHPRFAVAHVASDRSVRGWHTRLAGPVDALAVAGYSILLRTRSSGLHRYWLGRLGEGEVIEDLTPLVPNVSDGAPLESLGHIVSRGDSLYAFADGGCYWFHLEP